MLVTLEEATEATDIALAQCIKDINENPEYGQREKDKLIDTLLDTRQKSIDSLMKMNKENNETYHVGSIVIINQKSNP